jgi:hypothetical protein
LAPSYSQEEIGPSPIWAFTVVKVVPVICDAAAADSALHTLNFVTLPVEPDPPAAAVLAAAAAPALVALAAAGVDPLAADVDLGEQAVTDTAAARVRLAAVTTAATRMVSPRKFVKGTVVHGAALTVRAGPRPGIG